MFTKREYDETLEQRRDAAQMRAEARRVIAMKEIKDEIDACLATVYQLPYDKIFYSHYDLIDYVKRDYESVGWKVTKINNPKQDWLALRFE